MHTKIALLALLAIAPAPEPPKYATADLDEIVVFCTFNPKMDPRSVEVVCHSAKIADKSTIAAAGGSVPQHQPGYVEATKLEDMLSAVTHAAVGPLVKTPGPPI